MFFREKGTNTTHSTLIVMLDFFRTKIQSAESRPGKKPNRSLKLRGKDVGNCKTFYILFIVNKKKLSTLLKTEL